MEPTQITALATAVATILGIITGFILKKRTQDVNNFNQVINQMRETISGLEKRIASLEAKNGELAERLQVEMAKSSRLEAENEYLKREVKELEFEIAEMKG
ncbi:hypothetical protein [Mesobacillus persicus]|uniref:hypothetical protein n=1 Tax=Mesobacillus persicus TaxID=930146 RepID=UPI000B818E7E|nr:hypothetical protein [Mesobacillus persicus]